MSNISKIDEWLKKDNLILLEGWARNGLSNEQIAHNMGITTETLRVWKRDNSVISATLNKSKEIADLQVENALFRKCLGYKETVKEIRVDKNGKQQPASVREIYIQPDITAIKFWLVNRQRDRWKEKVEEIVDDTQMQKVEELLNKIKEEANDTNE